jgi:hypothetical protein
MGGEGKVVFRRGLNHLIAFSLILLVQSFLLLQVK